MNKRMFIFALSFFSMSLFCSECFSIKNKTLLGNKRKFCEIEKYSQVKAQDIEKQSLSILQCQDDDVEMTDAADIQKSGDAERWQPASLLEETSTGSDFGDVLLTELQQVNESIGERLQPFKLEWLDFLKSKKETNMNKILDLLKSLSLDT